MILVSGGSGVVGAKLVRGLLARGLQVRALVLPDDPLNSRLEALCCDVHSGDITEPRTLLAAFDGVRTVYHLAAVVLSADPRVFERVNVGGTRNMLRAAAGAAVQHFIHVSSASVTYPRRTPYADSKLRAEALVRQRTDMHTTIVRPTLVYERGGGQEFQMFRDSVLRFPVVPFVGAGRSRKSPVLADDLVAGLVAIAGNERTYGRTYSLSGGESITMRELAREILSCEGRSRTLIHLPVPLCKLLARLCSVVMEQPALTLSAIAGVTQDADLDCTEARRDFGYNPVGVREGLRRCYGSGVTACQGMYEREPPAEELSHAG